MRTRFAASFLLLFACLAVPAAGQEVPDDAPVVAQETGKWTLQAFERNGKLCHSFVAAEEVSPIGDCARYRRPTAVATQLRYEVAGNTAWLVGVVPLDVAAVEAELRDGRRVRAETFASGPYQGVFADRVRFLALRLPGRLADGIDSVRIARFLAADGRIVGAHADFLSGPRYFDDRGFARGGRPGARWELRTDAVEELVPTPTALDRLEVRRCVVLRAPGERSRQRTCFTPGAPDLPIRFAWDAGCGAAGTHIAVLAAPGVRKVRAVLGDGRRRPVRLRALPAAYEGHRAGVVRIGRGAAVRALVGDGAPPQRIGLAPATADCDAAGHSNDEPFVSPVFPDPTRRGTGVTVRDEGARLCVALGPVRPFADCLLAPVDALESRFISRREGGTTTVLGVVTADVAAVEFRSPSGPVRVVPSDVGYTGQYREQLRFVHATLPGRKRLWGPRLLAADGSRIATGAGPDIRYALTPRTVARHPSGVQLSVGIVALGRQSVPCSLISVGPATPQELDGCWPMLTGLAEVMCTPRRIVIASILPRSARSVEVRLASGKVLRYRSVRVPGMGGRAFLVVLPRDAAPRSLRIPGEAALPQRLPPASEQCGYRGPLI